MDISKCHLFGLESLCISLHVMKLIMCDATSHVAMSLLGLDELGELRGGNTDKLNLVGMLLRMIMCRV